ncbi:MAG: hypothetical protein IPN94_18815 [Sphingobacteriales bacterium]|nr:hypothetical protein [Sphingobacteriales bacterium]
MGADGVASAGDIITYTYVVTNTGNVTLTSVGITEQASFTGSGGVAAISAITYQSSTDAATAPSTLSVGESATYTATYAITAADITATFVNNQAQASGNPPTGSPVTDLSDSSNPAQAGQTGTNDPTNTPLTAPAISLVKGSSLALGADGVASAGDVITYTYVVTNTGNVTLTSVAVTEQASFTGSGGVAAISAITYQSSTDAATAPSTLSVGESATYTATYAITALDIAVVE